LVKKEAHKNEQSYEEISKKNHVNHKIMNDF